jgi:hypothetical protein
MEGWDRVDYVMAGIGFTIVAGVIVRIVMHFILGSPQ